MSPLGRPPVMLDIVEEHFEELDFLWEQREGVIFAPDWNLEELAELEERAEAHLDGLRLAELHAVDIARPALTGDETFAATAATFVFMETGEPELAQEVLKAFETAEAPETRDGIRIGLRHSRIDAVADDLTELAASGAPALRAAAADVLAFHRRSIPDIRDLLTTDDPGVLVLAYGALGRAGTPLDPALLSAGLERKAPEVQRAALEAAARSGMPGLETICANAAGHATHPNPEALAFVGVLGNPAYWNLLQAGLGRPELVLAAIRGLGALGRVEAIPLLIQAMANPELAHAAGAAFQRITGAEDIEGARPEPPPDSNDVEAEFADDTPPPDPAKAQSFWSAHERLFDPAGRWQTGCNIGAEPLGASFNALTLESRRDVYLGGRARTGPPLPDLELERRAAPTRS